MLQPLGVQFDVQAQQSADFLLRQLATMFEDALQQQFLKVLNQGSMPIRCATRLYRYRYMDVYQVVQFLSVDGQVAYAAIMRQKGINRLVTHDAFQGGVGGYGIKLHGGGGGEYKLHAIHVEFTVGKAKCVTGEKQAIFPVENTVVMASVPRGIERPVSSSTLPSRASTALGDGALCT